MTSPTGTTRRGPIAHHPDHRGRRGRAAADRLHARQRGAGPATSSTAARPRPRRREPVGRYVALGDSYAAGPLIPTTDLAAGCARSDHNYPALVADALDVHDFVDVTCSGATTRDLTHVQRTFGDARIPPQLRAVTPETDAGHAGDRRQRPRTCSRRWCAPAPGCGPPTRRAPRARAGSPPRAPTSTAAVATISRHVTGVLRTIRRKAPDAKVLLVGYLRLVPDRGSCVGAAAGGRRLRRGPADQPGARPGAPAGGPPHGHHVRRHVLRLRGPRHLRAAPRGSTATSRSGEKALAYHPFASGMRADAREVLRALGR